MRNERSANLKKLQLTNVLNMQQDGIIIFNVSEKATDLEGNETLTLGGTVNIEFSNTKSKEMFGVDLCKGLSSSNIVERELAFEKLSIPSMMPLA